MKVGLRNLLDRGNKDALRLVPKKNAEFGQDWILDHGYLGLARKLIKGTEPVACLRSLISWATIANLALRTSSSIAFDACWPWATPYMGVQRTGFALVRFDGQPYYTSILVLRLRVSITCSRKS